MLVMSKTPEKLKPNHGSRIQTMSIPALVEGVVMLRLKLNRIPVKHRGRKLKDGPLINAIMAWFLGQSDERQIEIARERLRRYEAMLEGDIAPSVEEPDFLNPRYPPGFPGGVSDKGGKPKRPNSSVKKRH